MSATTPVSPAPSIPSSPLPGAADTRPAAERREARRAALVGNFVDQFDIFLPVVALAGVLPTHSSIPDGLVFAATLLGRPVGAFVLGSLADRRGRALVSRTTLLGVSLCTGIMAALPLHTPGFALGALLALRFVAGFLLGGQYSAAIPRALARTPPARRGHLSGLVMAMSPLANAVIAAATMVLTQILGGAYSSWGWRLTFVVGALMPLCLALSLRHADAPAPAPHRPVDDRAPQRGTFTSLFVLMTGLWLFTMMGVSVLTSMLRTHFDPHDVGLVMLVATAVSAPTMAAAGALSGRIGRHTFFIVYGLASALVAPVTYVVATHAATRQDLALAALAAAAVQVSTVTAYGPAGTYLAENFPESRRSRGYGSAYSASIVLPGLYPFWLPSLTRWVGQDRAAPCVLALAGILVASAAAWLRGRNLVVRESSETMTTPPQAC